MENLEEFTSQAYPDVLMSMRQIATEERRSFQSVLDEAMRDLIEKKKDNKARKNITVALHESIQKFDDLYRELAK